MFGLLSNGRREAPLPEVAPPEVPRDERRFVARLFEQSRRYMDEPLEAFDLLSRSCKEGWSVFKRPVEGTKARVATSIACRAVAARGGRRAAAWRPGRDPVGCNAVMDRGGTSDCLGRS
jgi:hypothetical protein